MRRANSINLFDMIRDRRTGYLSAEKFWYNVKSAASVFCLIWYITQPALANTLPADPLIIALFLLLNEASAVSFIGLAARRYGINFLGNGSKADTESGDEVGRATTMGDVGVNSGSDGMGGPPNRCGNCGASRQQNSQ